jgi:putative ABC transport system substrate-binding protein
LDTWQAGLAGLRERGYIQGQNLVVECRWTEGRQERAAALAVELVRLKPDLIVGASSQENVYAARQATAFAAEQGASMIPIVMASVMDPMALVASFARPGGNVTGLTYDAGVEILGKQLQFLKEVVPHASRVAVLDRMPYPRPSWSSERREEAKTAQALGLMLQYYNVWEPEDITGAFAAMTKARAEAFFIEASFFFNVHRQRLVELAAQHRLPGMYPFKEMAVAGGLMFYGPNEPALYRRVGFYVDKIFKGAKPADLPVEQPTKFEMVINLKTAKALGLTIPQSLLMRADEVIE